MQYSSILSIVALVSTVVAAPAPIPEPSKYATVIFHGAAGAQYSVVVPLDGAETPTNNVLSISSVSSDIVNVKEQCVLKTVDQPPVLVAQGAGTWTVGPPQTVKTISCKGKDVNPPIIIPSSISIEFDGADPTLGAKYTVNVPLNGVQVPTNNALSISTLVSTFDALPSKCTFDYVDRPAALVLIAPGKWSVGPPQTIKAVSCVA
ncbi:hypothetical protein HYALB_00007284 [Hymenoscyphus albidus]|uniref:Ubiquitin 3 binding protein But2 C-terminal domain-containing protein n=1 Tax=Hymenoscyphus albidus TaxID=595503 RepID=A0A9N9LX57_9HELO|nr:hypothetical protein HYALB_00007284 [Hymenoscyphus albidus]